MSFLTKDPGRVRDPAPRGPNNIFKFSEPRRPGEFQNPTLIVAWKEDAGKLSPCVVDYINEKLGAKSFCEVEPMGFFSLEGVAIENDTAQFPEGKFYRSERKDLVTFKGSEPHFERYRFLNALSDLAQHYCKIKELYTVGGTISPIAHSSPRKVLAVFNQPEIQEELSGYGLNNMNWQGPPAISSFLLWIAQRKAIPGVSLWTEIPFYLAPGEDLQATKKTLAFFDKRFDLALDLAGLDEEIRQQNAKIDQLRQDDPEIDRYIGMLESRLSLSAEEQLGLTKKVTEALEEED
jgi:proteasome assembly chaperone (PAC2) family protein